MDRQLSYAFNDPIREAFDSIPDGIEKRLRHAHFCCGCNPAFVGLHFFGDTGDGRSYADVAHVAFLCHQKHMPVARRRTTVVLPVLEAPFVIAHELGHVLDEAIDFDHQDCASVSEYAKSDALEAFAEAFTAWLGWYGDEANAMVDDETRALFDMLSR